MVIVHAILEREGLSGPNSAGMAFLGSALVGVGQTKQTNNSNDTQTPVPAARRMVPEFGVYPNGTNVLNNVTVPTFYFQTFEWITNATAQLSPEIYEAVTNQNSGLLNISSSINPLSQTIAGTSALLKDTA